MKRFSAKPSWTSRTRGHDVIRTTINAGVGMFSLVMLATSVSPLWSDLSSAEAQEQAQDVSSASFRGLEIAIPMDDHGMKAAGISTIHVVPDDGKTELTFPARWSFPSNSFAWSPLPRAALSKRCWSIRTSP